MEVYSQVQARFLYQPLRGMASCGRMWARGLGALDVQLKRQELQR